MRKRHFGGREYRFYCEKYEKNKVSQNQLKPSNFAFLGCFMSLNFFVRGEYSDPKNHTK